ncbi:MAG: hypothetical protein IID42_06250 [Planctomycetes bacterium]|nr:hypothetical protein [Planctomycetota bacterium]
MVVGFGAARFARRPSEDHLAPFAFEQPAVWREEVKDSNAVFATATIVTKWNLPTEVYVFVFAEVVS